LPFLDAQTAASSPIMAADDQFNVLFTSYTNVTVALSSHVAYVARTPDVALTGGQAHKPYPKPACFDPNPAHALFTRARSGRLSSCSDILQLGSGYRRCQSVQANRGLLQEGALEPAALCVCVALMIGSLRALAAVDTTKLPKRASLHRLPASSWVGRSTALRAHSSQ
jgi:hypothetical protein